METLTLTIKSSGCSLRSWRPLWGMDSANFASQLWIFSWWRRETEQWGSQGVVLLYLNSEIPWELTAAFWAQKYYKHHVMHDEQCSNEWFPEYESGLRLLENEKSDLYDPFSRKPLKCSVFCRHNSLSTYFIHLEAQYLRAEVLHIPTHHVINWQCNWLILK